MDDGQILIVNLAKGQLGSDTSNALGRMITSELSHAAYSRHNISEAERRPFFLYVDEVDEFQSFTSDAMVEMLSELRKYGLSPTLANQYFGKSKARFWTRFLATSARCLPSAPVRWMHPISADNLTGLNRAI